MIQLTPQMRILLAVEPADFRRQIDGLARMCREELSSDAMSGTVFVFRNRRATAIKLLIYDGQGFWLCHKRLSTGHFCWWPQRRGHRTIRLEAHEVQLLLWNGDPTLARAQPAWRPLAVGE
jgi:transposase